MAAGPVRHNRHVTNHALSELESEIAALLSAPRMAAYLAASPDGTTRSALELYRWNLRASAAFYESIHYLEVALRNVCDNAIAAWHRANHRDAAPWYRCARMPLKPEARSKVNQAIAFATMRGTRPELPGRVVTELPFGFWRSLVSEAYNRSLWQPILRPAFPTVRRGRLHGALGEFVTIRNRTSHGEPIHHRDLAADYQLLLRTAGCIHPALAAWVANTTAVPAVLAGSPANSPPKAI
jgi:hypothetical protein